MNTKKAFYPTDEVELYLENIPKGQFSSRINELILKGLTFEYQEKVKQAYARFNHALAKEKLKKRSDTVLSGLQLMAARAFDSEDEVEDFI